MNVQIRDPALFQHLAHLDVRAYLAGQRWTEAGRIGNKATRLDREPDQFDGRATLRLLIDNRPLHVSVQFERSMFDTVIHAFRDRIPISLDGDLVPVGQRYELGNPRNLTLILDADEPNPDNPSDAEATTGS